MTDNDQDPTRQVEAARKAFEQEFERFARFTDDSTSISGVGLEQALAEQRALAEPAHTSSWEKERTRGMQKVDRPRRA
jgi:hypothetical protein